MAESTLEDRLREHAEAFDGLLSLIPAKHYYPEDNSDQWKKKKQTKEQAAAARRAKLDPDSAKSAKDVMDERARKRKLEDVEESEESDIEGIEKELPRQGLKQQHDKKTKKQKISDLSDIPKTTSDIPHEDLKQTEATNQAKADLNLQKQQLKKEKQAKKVEQQKAQAQVIPKDTVALRPLEADAETSNYVKKAMVDDNDLSGDEIEHFEAEGLEENPDTQNSSPSSVTSHPSPTFDGIEPSTNTSTSSVIPPATAPKHIKLPTDPELLKARLAARIDALRAARKADGPNGARNRQELMEARRKKEEQRKAHKKELRLKARAEEEARREAALLSARESPASSMLSPLTRSPDNNFSFGRVSFADGQQLTNDLSTPAKKKRQRIAGFDNEKRADIEEKDLWLNAKKRAYGDKVRDDTSLLKKTLKRKEKEKKKSEKEWGERKDGVAKGQAMRQKKREENLKKRRDEKGVKGKGKGKAPKSKKTKVKSRPGFEGSFGSGGKRR
ncbi:hypothetical protein B7494_g6949 [Chlorociboria aeruginascens]|nr:hypothetical protein B7494_g6949 [Chlorociboria aeruginascens]